VEPLSACQMLDTASEPEFDGLVPQAAGVFEAPIAREIEVRLRSSLETIGGPDVSRRFRVRKRICPRRAVSALGWQAPAMASGLVRWATVVENDSCPSRPEPCILDSSHDTLARGSSCGGISSEGKMGRRLAIGVVLGTALRGVRSAPAWATLGHRGVASRYDQPTQARGEKRKDLDRSPA
jgi:hypothetical protein